MRNGNPFSPAFGISPNLFFGRGEQLQVVIDALDSPQSIYRAFFLEGLRGSGKTVLLHQMCEIARQRGWDAIELQSAHAAQGLRHHLGASGSSARYHFQLAPKAVLPGGGQISGIEAGVDKALAADEPPLLAALEDRCKGMAGECGVLIAIDEAQRLRAEDALEICSAFQATRIRGYQVMLVFAGLPGTKRRISGYDGCTFLKRAPREVLRLLTRSETKDAFRMSLAQVPEIQTSDEMLYRLSHFTQGHPYIIQLLGFHLYENMDMMYGDVLEAGAAPIAPGEGEMDDAEDRAYWTYREDVLQPIMGALRGNMPDYVRALASTMDENGVMRSGGELARLMGKESVQELSMARKQLLDACIVEDAGYGKLRFMLPYIPRYISEDADARAHTGDDDWDVEV